MELIITATEEEVLETFIKNECDITNKEIADKLCKSPRTIERHSEKMRKRNNINTLVGVAFQYLKIHKELLAVFFITLQLFSIGYKKTKRRSKVKTQIARVKTLHKTRTKNLKYYPVA